MLNYSIRITTYTKVWTNLYKMLFVITFDGSPVESTCYVTI